MNSWDTLRLAIGGARRIFDRPVPDRLRDIQRKDVFDDWGMLALVVAGMVLVGVLVYVWRRRVERKLDEAILAARASELGFTPTQRDLILRIAEIGKAKKPSEVASKLKRYSESLEAYLVTVDRTDQAQLEALLETLGEIRTKLGFDRLPNYRTVPSTREVGSGTVLKVRPLGGEEFVSAVVSQVHDLEMRIRMIPADDRDEEDDGLPIFAAGDEVEATFPRTDEIRCHFVARVGAPEEEGRVLPIEHVHVRNVYLRARPDARVEGQLRTPDGRDVLVTLAKLGGRGVLIEGALPDDVDGGRLMFSLPGMTELLMVDVERGADGGGSATSLEFVDPDPALWLTLVAHERRSVRLPARITGVEGTMEVAVISLGAESLAIDPPAAIGAQRASLVLTLPEEVEASELLVTEVGGDGTVFRIDDADSDSRDAIERHVAGRTAAARG